MSDQVKMMGPNEEEKRNRDDAVRNQALRDLLPALNARMRSAEADPLVTTAFDAVIRLRDAERPLDRRQDRRDRFPELFPFAVAASEELVAEFAEQRWRTFDAQAKGQEILRELAFELCDALGPCWEVAMRTNRLRDLIPYSTSPTPAPPSLRSRADQDESLRALLTAFARSRAEAIVP